MMSEETAFKDGRRQMIQKWKKRKTTVSSRIFYSNALMILVTIALSLVIGMICVKIYWEKEERMLQEMLGSRLVGAEAESFVRSITVHNDLFILMTVLFALSAIAVLIIVSFLFTGILTRKIMEPLKFLEEGAERIRQGDYSGEIQYQGDIEFEQVCEAFNGMQLHLKEEKERNARYEKARREMIAGISHDLRSPLTAIRGSVKGVLDGVAGTPALQKKFLEAAYRRSGEMDVLLSELFYFSKLETGGIPVNNRPVDLSAYLNHYVEAKKSLPDFAEAEFVCDLPDKDEKPTLVDPEALQRILDNILSNSMKYAGVSPVRFYVGLKQEEGKKTIILQDNGKGLPEEKIDRIFEEFYRADESRSRKEGSGLGLYIVKYLCDAMGGQVSADQKSHYEGFSGLAISLTLNEGGAKDDEQGNNPDH